MDSFQILLKQKGTYPLWYKRNVDQKVFTMYEQNKIWILSRWYYREPNDMCPYSETCLKRPPMGQNFMAYSSGLYHSFHCTTAYYCILLYTAYLILYTAYYILYTAYYCSCYCISYLIAVLFEARINLNCTGTSIIWALLVTADSPGVRIIEIV